MANFTGCKWHQKTKGIPCREPACRGRECHLYRHLDDEEKAGKNKPRLAKQGGQGNGE